MSILEPKPLTSAAAKKTYVRFLDTDGNPIEGSLVTIVVDTVNNEVSDIIVEEI
jgi:hypothetical protein